MKTRRTAVYTINQTGDTNTDFIVTIKTDVDGTDIIDRRQLLAAARELKCTEYDIRSYRNIWAPTKKGTWYNLKTGIRPEQE